MLPEIAPPRIPTAFRTPALARNLSVCVSRICYTAPGIGQAVFAEEVFDLPVSLGGGSVVFNLAAGAHRFVDVTHTEIHTLRQNVNPPGDVKREIPKPAEGCEAVYKFDFVQSPDRLKDRKFLRGRYVAHVFASAENAQSVCRDISWNRNGRLNHLTIVH